MRSPRAQRGATLIITLTILVVILLLGVASVRLRALDEHAARNHQGLNQARLAAQAALDDALVDLGSTWWQSKPPILNTDVTLFASTTAMVAKFDGHRLPTPTYQIERIKVRPERQLELYRISAWGYGAGQARAALQMLVQRRKADTGTFTLKVVGWRRRDFHDD